MTGFFFLSLKDLPRSQRFRWGYATGVASFALINWWLIPTITRASPVIGASLPVGFILSLVAVTAIAVIHGFGPAVSALIWRESSLWRIAIAALVWLAWEWLRSQGPLAHSWGTLGYSQVADLRLLKLLPHTYLLSAFCVVVGTLLAGSVSRRMPSLSCAALILLILGHVGVSSRSESSGNFDQGRILVVQTTARTTGQGSATGVTAIVQAYRLTKEALAKNPRADLIIWPETTVELTRDSSGDFRGLDWAILSTQGFNVPLLTGALVTGADGRRRNEAVVISPGNGVSSYAKRRLVPFGERAPFSGVFPWLARFAPEPALEPGTAADPLKATGPHLVFWLRTLICFESCFPSATRERPVNDTYPSLDLDVVLTNDQWFAGTEAPREHRAMGIMRAVEGGRYLVQSANGGYTFAVLPSGKVIFQLPFGTPGVLDIDLSKQP